jgi:dolichyl-phosphate-mannose--protein O-mannosyl transferase
VLLPIAVYMASYGRWFVDHGFHLSDWFKTQRAMLDYSLNLRAPHPYSSRPWKWPLMIRPVAYFYKGGSNPSTSAEVLGMGNPLLFWACLVAIPYTLVAGLRRRDWRAALILVAYGSQYFAWYFAARTAFLFYMTPITPFMVLALTYGVRDLSTFRAERPAARVTSRVLAAFVVVACVGTFAYFFPILIGRVISYSAWHQRMWLPMWI